MPKKLVYVIQRHDASHLHYDLRLEMNGILKSWAIPKEPPKVKGVKRLAVSVEDHTLGYEKFEGTIPEGQYGAGKVKTWDKGYYIPLESKKSVMVFDIHGKVLKGAYCLIKLNPKTDKYKSKNTNWLFFKK